MPGNDCVAYAFANMVGILHGIDPSSVSFNVSAMRRNLQQGLGNKKITVFLHRKFFCKNKPVLKVTGIPIFVHVQCQSMASCLHVQNVKTCTECKKWFHSSCQLINQTQRQVRSSKIITCLDCRKEITICCIFIFSRTIPYTDQSQTHDLHGPFHLRTTSNYIHGPFHSQTIPFRDHFQTDVRDL